MLNANQLKKYALFSLLMLSFLACKHDVPVPKPRGYYRIDFPTKNTDSLYTNTNCPFSFHYPDYILVENDTLFFNEKPDDPCWLNLKYRSLNGIIHISYKSLHKHELYELTEEYHRMKNEHVRVADFIDDLELKNKDKKIYGLLSDLGGDTASAHQFYITDSTNHYVRGSLYFFAEANADSLRPASNFVKKDIIEMLESWQWK